MDIDTLILIVFSLATYYLGYLLGKWERESNKYKQIKSIGWKLGKTDAKNE